MKRYHKVLLPIEVPVSEFCCDISFGGTICKYFDNKGGYYRCTLMSSWDLKYTYEGVLKAHGCAKLEVIPD